MSSKFQKSTGSSLDTIQENPNYTTIFKPCDLLTAKSPGDFFNILAVLESEENITVEYSQIPKLERQTNAPPGWIYPEEDLLQNLVGVESDSSEEGAIAPNYGWDNDYYNNLRGIQKPVGEAPKILLPGFKFNKAKKIVPTKNPKYQIKKQCISILNPDLDIIEKQTMLKRETNMPSDFIETDEYDFIPPEGCKKCDSFTCDCALICETCGKYDADPSGCYFCFQNDLRQYPDDVPEYLRRNLSESF